MEYIVEKNEELLKYLYSKLSNISKNNIKSLLKNEHILVNDRVVTKFNYLLKEKDTIHIIDNYIKDILSGNTIATADNNQLKGIIAKKTELDDVDVERNGNTYKMYWISDDGHHIEATLAKNKDVKIVSTDSNHNFD